MKKYVCDVCGYIYDPEVGDPDNGVEPGTAFEDVPEDLGMPPVLCGEGSVFCRRGLETAVRKRPSPVKRPGGLFCILVVSIFFSIVLFE